MLEKKKKVSAFSCKYNFLKLSFYLWLIQERQCQAYAMIFGCQYFKTKNCDLFYRIDIAPTEFGEKSFKK